MSNPDECRITFVEEKRFRSRRKVSLGIKLDFNIDDYFTNNCGINSFEDFQGRGSSQEYQKLIEYGLTFLEKGTGVAASLPLKNDYGEDIEIYIPWDKALRALRFRVVRTFTNPNSGNICRFYFRLA